MDFELEIGIFIGVGNPDRSQIPVEEAGSHIFGLVLLNDWKELLGQQLANNI